MRKIFIALVASLLVSVGSDAMLRQTVPANLQESRPPVSTVSVTTQAPVAPAAKTPAANSTQPHNIIESLKKMMKMRRKKRKDLVTNVAIGTKMKKRKRTMKVMMIKKRTMRKRRKKKSITAKSAPKQINSE